LSAESNLHERASLGTKETTLASHQLIPDSPGDGAPSL